MIHSMVDCAARCSANLRLAKIFPPPVGTVSVRRQSGLDAASRHSCEMRLRTSSFGLFMVNVRMWSLNNPARFVQSGLIPVVRSWIVSGFSISAVLGRTLRAVSIRAPLAGSDIHSSMASASLLVFQSAPPLRGATHPRLMQGVSDKFQSAPPGRGATVRFRNLTLDPTRFNPRPPCGERRWRKPVRRF